MLKHYNFLVEPTEPLYDNLVVGVIAQNHYVAKCDCIDICRTEHHIEPKKITLEEWWDLD